ncbi:hypothetical protein Q9L58_000914 [Maublancomyces gigas]|uniref:Major facilitator superfamily (MFS) profile domain-containing protein n=1 Tax=Discina gigas TaxID=1032678 RepID=A0ABR3GVV8_9PEZI
MIGIGFIVSTWVGYGAAHAENSSFQWRFPLAFQGVPAGALAIGLIWFPESPRQLIEKDNDEEALRVLKRLHATGLNDEWINSEFNEIRQTILAEKALVVRSWTVMFTVPQWRNRLMHGVMVQVFTQLTGINVINYYQTIMYKALGIVGRKALLVSGIYNIVGPVTNAFFIFFLIDRVGRRKPLLFGTIGISLCLIIEAVLISQNPDGNIESLSRAGVAMLFLVSMIFSVSFGPVSWTYMSEVMPMQIRGNGNAFATGIGNWLVNVLFSQVSPQALAKLTWKYYFVFVAFNLVVTLPTVFFVFKETKGVSLEDIDLLFGERIFGDLQEDGDKHRELQIEHSFERDNSAA